MSTRIIVQRSLAVLLSGFLVLGTGCSRDAERRTDHEEGTALTAASRLIEKSIEHLDAVERLDTALTLAYLQRKFGAVADLTWADDLLASVIADIGIDNPDSLGPFLRLITDDVASPLSEPRELIDEDDRVRTDDMLLHGLWCDHLPLPDGFPDQLELIANRGGYELTHAFAAAQLSLENGCGERDDLTATRDRLAKKMADLITVVHRDDTETGHGEAESNDTSLGVATDLELEVCAFLAWGDNVDLVPGDFQKIVVASQLEDGGWSVAIGDSHSDPHATMFGLRCMLELEHAATIDHVDWVVR